MEVSRNGLFVCATREEEIDGDRRFQLALKRLQKATQDYEKMMDLRSKQERALRRQSIRSAILRIKNAMLMRK